MVQFLTIFFLHVLNFYLQGYQYGYSYFGDWLCEIIMQTKGSTNHAGYGAMIFCDAQRLFIL